MISVEAYKISIGMFFSRLIVFQKSKNFKALSSSTPRVKRKWEVFFSFFGYIFLVIICLNLHFAVVNLLNLTLEGAESDPGPNRFSFISSDYSDSVDSSASSAGLRNFAIKKSVQASHHQGHLKYRKSAGMQCISNAYFAIAYSVIKKPSIWKLWALDYVLEQGDILFKNVGIGQPLAVDELPINFKIESFDLNTVMLDQESHLMQSKNDLFENCRHLTQRSTGDWAIFTCAGFSVAIMCIKTSVLLLDSHSCNNQGFQYPNGKATLLEFRSMLSLNKFLKTFFIENVGVSAEA